MRGFFSLAIHISSLIALLTVGVFYTGMITGNKTILNADAFQSCHAYMKSCRNAGIAFTGLSWLLITGGPAAECAAGYVALSKTCLHLGVLWIAVFFSNLIVGIFRGFWARDDEERIIMRRLRLFDIGMSAIFLTLAFLLNPSFPNL